MKKGFMYWLSCGILLLSCAKHKSVIGPIDPVSTEPRIEDRYNIVFVSERGGKTFQKQVYLMNSDGSGLTQLTNDQNDYFYPFFSPDGEKVLFYSHTIDNTDEVFQVHIDGTGFENLSQSPGDDYQPAYSPDGSRVVFVSNRDGNAEIYIMNSDGSNPIRLTESETIEFVPQFIEGGTKILFNSVQSATGRLSHIVMNLDGSEKTDLTGDKNLFLTYDWWDDATQNTYDARVSVSSNGKKMTFMAWHPTYSYCVYTMNSDGSDLQLIENTAGENLAPVFYPDGETILFRSHRGPSYELFQLSLQGDILKNLTNAVGHAYFSQFSQDGSRILYNTDEWRYYKIWMMDSNGTNAVKLTDGAYHDYYPQFYKVEE